MEDSIIGTAQFTKDELKSALKQHLNADKNDVLVDALMGCLIEDTNSINQLAKALLGIRPQMQYAVGDEIMVKLTGVGTWLMNQELMIQENMIDTTSFKDHTIKCKVIKVKPYKSQPYDVEYYILKNDETDPKPSLETSYTWSNYILGMAEEWPD